MVKYEINKRAEHSEYIKMENQSQHLKTKYITSYILADQILNNLLDQIIQEERLLKEGTYLYRYHFYN